MQPTAPQTVRPSKQTVRWALYLISTLLLLPILIMVLIPTVIFVAKLLLLGLLFLVFLSLYLVALLGSLVGVL